MEMVVGPGPPPVPVRDLANVGALRVSPMGLQVAAKCRGPAPEAEGLGAASLMVRGGGHCGEGPRKVQSCENAEKAWQDTMEAANEGGWGVEAREGEGGCHKECR